MITCILIDTTKGAYAVKNNCEGPEEISCATLAQWR